ncbi:hypothetical protein FEM48_Zijuj04G0079400 [Ziziphus jujuba var. spinosa]|uniref:G-type lectin S-receptor-like serine/threonine-protein kinase At2g19130 n=1 Tax=Ziziphus jujuba var. spinosa TaxID=714518 RepID=A0A978VIP7_ZIZJJ|nr:hypothetical protein FEM48_Zijuj04G0079400 [Ziziphus jujuba var. spinosa]
MFKLIETDRTNLSTPLLEGNPNLPPWAWIWLFIWATSYLGPNSSSFMTNAFARPGGVKRSQSYRPLKVLGCLVAEKAQSDGDSHPPKANDRFSSALRISNGNLVLFNESQIPIWSTNVKPTTLATTQAVLLDNGNLVVDDGSRPSTLLWQSFDYPCNTFLPGGRIGHTGINKGHKIVLTSWKSSEDPAPGDYSLEQFLIGSEVYFVMRSRTSSEISWSTGTWNGKTFSLVPEMRLNYIFNYSYVSNANESYFTYDLYNSSLISRFIIDVSGQLKQMSWLRDGGWILFWSQPKNPCEVYAVCGAYGSCIGNSLRDYCRCLTGFEPKSPSDWSLTEYSGGCGRKAELQCRNTDRFTKNPGMSLSGAEKTVLVRNTAECEATCLNDCSCTAYAYESNSCLIWNGDLMNLNQLALNDSRGKALFKKKKKENGRSWKINGGFAGASIIIEGGDVFSLLDPRLEGNADPEKLIRVCRLACWCIQYEETQRPSMGQIVQILEGLVNVNLPPLPRLFQAFVDNPDEIISSTKLSSSPESSQAGSGMSTASSRVKSTESSSLLMS